MPDLEQVDPSEVEQSVRVASPREFSVDFPKKAVSAAELRRLRKAAFADVEAPTGPQPRAKTIKGMLPTGEELKKLRAIRESTTATAEMISQELDADATIGLTYSALVIYEYSRMRSEYEKRLKTAKERRRVETQWQKIVAAATEAMDKAGVKGLAEADLNRAAAQLTRSKANFESVVEIANSARDEEVANASGIVTPKGHFVTIYDRIDDILDVVIPTPPNLCEQPIQGKYTKHFGWSFNLSVRITYWCPTWTNPFRTCTKTITVGGVSVGFGLEVGYRITCCGAVAWGAGYAQACVNIAGVTVCASCSAVVVGVAGIGKTGSGSKCNYGLGVVAEVKCVVAGVTVFSASVPFGWTITGPCPPPELPC
jgi:hypothetical protein